MEFQIFVITTSFIVAFVVVQHGNCQRVNVGNGFVQRKGTHFILNEELHYVNGFNSYWLMNFASDPSTMYKVSSTFQQASQHGLNLGRTWAFNDGGYGVEGYGALQISPGTYDEKVFRGLDFVISEARKYGVQLILGLVNNWNDFGGKNKYLQWARERGQNVTNDDDFFTHPIVKKYYKNHVKTVLTRKNTINGVVYKDDPTIFAWELMNEPRNLNDSSGKSIQDWVREMAAYVKSIDNNHLLEIGLEGFYGQTMPQKKVQFNPPYSVIYGTDFISNNQVPEIDFATIHLYPDQWLNGSTETAQSAFVDRWIEAHIQDSNNVLGKPLIVAEFGKNSKLSGYSIDKRDMYFNIIYNAISRSAISGGSCAGGIFWQLFSQGMDNMKDGYEVVFEDNPSTSEVIKQQSMKMSHIK